jgi:LTXXQ motif family protein
MIFRALASALLTGSIILAAGSAPAQDTGTGAAPDGQTPPPTAADPTAARIKYLHDRLRITAEQEDLWEKVGQTIHDNERNLTPLRKERLRTTTGGSALELLHAYDALGQAQLDSLKNIVTVFEPLYASLSESQKKIADAILREGAQNAMIVPFVPPPFTSALAFPSGAYPVIVYPSVAYPSSWSGTGLAVTTHPAGFHHFHGFIAPHGHFGRFHHR